MARHRGAQPCSHPEGGSSPRKSPVHRGLGPFCGTRPLRPSWCPEGRNSPVSAESHSPGYGRTLRMLALSAAYSSCFPASVAAYISVQKRLISRRKIRSEKHHPPGTQHSRQEDPGPVRRVLPALRSHKSVQDCPAGIRASFPAFQNSRNAELRMTSTEPAL